MSDHSPRLSFTRVFRVDACEFLLKHDGRFGRIPQARESRPAKVRRNGPRAAAQSHRGQGVSNNPTLAPHQEFRTAISQDLAAPTAPVKSLKLHD